MEEREENGIEEKRQLFSSTLISLLEGGGGRERKTPYLLGRISLEGKGGNGSKWKDTELMFFLRDFWVYL